ncbi:hypothetical protein ABPG75_004033 [Micractinium tetrahymenae]
MRFRRLRAAGKSFSAAMDSSGLRHKRQALPFDAPAPDTPCGGLEHPRRWSGFLALPDELTHSVLLSLEARDLCKLSCSCSQLREAAQDCSLWRREFEREYGEAGPLQEAAALRAGGWKSLFSARHAALKEADPWLKPSAFEVEVSVDALVQLPPEDPADGQPGEAATAPAAPSAAAEATAAQMGAEAAAPGAAADEQQEIVAEEEAELCLVFLVDGSGSVTEEDFRVMTDFMLSAVRQLAAAPHGPRSRVAVVQFSNDVRVEQGPVPVDVAQFEALMGNMHLMNGGTNIALAVQKAGQLLKPLGPCTHRVLALLTDGRIDSHQSREAAEMAARLGDEQACVRLHAYGVGRGVDREELMRIIGGREPETAADRYLGLMVLDEAPW